MTIDELLEHADRLEDDLRHKRREIREHHHSTYTEETLLRQCDALGNRVSQIRHDCAVLQVRAAVAAGNAALAA